MNSLETRLTKLEKTLGPARMFVVQRDEGESSETAIAEAGISPTDDDLVILVTRFTEARSDRPIAPRLISTHRLKS